MNIPEVMLASDFADRYGNPIRPYSEYANKFCIQPKLDGIRALIIHKDGKTRVFGRNKTKTGERSDFTQSLPEIIELFHGYIYDFILDVELMSKNFLKLQSKVKTTKFVVQDPDFYFTAFDLLQWVGRDLTNSDPYKNRYAQLKHIRLRHAASPLFQCVDDFGIVGSLCNPEEHIQFCLDEVIKKGGEGLILKRTESAYLPGKRSTDWVKVLPYRETDVMFLDCIIGTGKYSSTLGKIRAVSLDKFNEYKDATPDNPGWWETKDVFQVGTGFTDQQRSDIWEAFQNNTLQFPIKGKVKYKELYPSGIPRMPVFLQFKED